MKHTGWIGEVEREIGSLGRERSPPCFQKRIVRRQNSQLRRCNLWELFEMDVEMVQMMRFHMSTSGLEKLQRSNMRIARKNILPPLEELLVPPLFALLPIPNMRQFPPLLKEIRHNTRRSLDRTFVVLHIH